MPEDERFEELLRLARQLCACLLLIDQQKPSHITPALPAAPPAITPKGETKNDELRDAIQDLLAEAGVPMKSSTIARKLNHAFNGRFRSLVKEMREQKPPLIVLDENNCYKVPD
jgi:hypothetical protein